MFSYLLLTVSSSKALKQDPVIVNFVSRQTREGKFTPSPQSLPFFSLRSRTGFKLLPGPTYLNAWNRLP